MKIGFTGTSKGMTKEQKYAFRTLLDKLYSVKEFHHGDCIGADAEAHEIMVLRYGTTIIIHIHPPDYSAKQAFCDAPSSFIHPSKPYLDRNKDIVNACDSLIATPEGPEITRSGTWSTIRYARKFYRPIYIIMPDGKF